jgi:hypothetical protein
MTAGSGHASSAPLVIHPSMANEREHSKAIRWFFVLQAGLVVVVVLSLVLGSGPGFLMLLIFPVETASLWFARRHYVSAARATVVAGDLLVERPFLRNRHVRAADVDLVLLLGAIEGRSNPFTTDARQLMVLGKARPRILLRMSGEIWPGRSLAEIAPALGVRAQTVGWISSKQLRREYRAASWPSAHPFLTCLVSLPLFVAFLVVLGTIVGPDHSP